MSLRGRFAPSPSGRMHLGNVFCALVSWLSVRAQGGEMILRIEDIDTARCKPEYTEQLIDDLMFLGLNYDEGIDANGAIASFCQSSRTKFYEQALHCLERKGLVYPCYCSRNELHAASAPHATDGRVIYSGACRSLTAVQRSEKTRPPAYRMKASEHAYIWTDGLFGEQRNHVQNDWGDFLLRRSDGLFAYQLAVVVDDAAMNITQVVRGRDLLSSVAPQLQLFDALECTAPNYYHIPLLVNEDGRRLSKRDQDLDMGRLRERYTAEELIGKLLYHTGIIAVDEPITAREAVSEFSWDKFKHTDCVIHTNMF